MKKKLLIVTVYGSYNHGSFLQAQALMEYCSSCTDVCLLNSKTRKWTIIGNSIKRAFSFIRMDKKIYKFFSYLFFEIIEAIKFKCNWNKLKHCNNTESDICLLGSDEIWNLSRKECNYPVFLGVGINSKLYSYAVSINNATEKDFNQNFWFQAQLDKIAKISVRDQYSKAILSKFTPKNISVVLDPTLLFSPTLEGKPRSKDYIAVYTFPGQINRENQLAIIEYAHRNNLELLAVGQRVSWCDKTVHSINGNPFCYFKKAKFVIVSTFHGTAFAINYNCNFLAYVGNHLKSKCLLEMFELTNRIVTEPQQIETLFNERIDYGKVNKILTKKRKESFDFLEAVLNEGD